MKLESVCKVLGTEPGTGIARSTHAAVTAVFRAGQVKASETGHSWSLWPGIFTVLQRKGSTGLTLEALEKRFIFRLRTAFLNQDSSEPQSLENGQSDNFFLSPAHNYHHSRCTGKLTHSIQ